MSVPNPAPVDDAACAALARHLCDEPGHAAQVDACARLRVGWALKETCYAAWSIEPPRALLAAKALRALANADGGPALGALADWTHGIACLIRSDMEAAVNSLDQAALAWRGLGEPLHAAHAQVPKTMALAVLGRFDEAEATALRTEAALHDQGDEQSAAKVRLNLGTLAFSRDQHLHALAHYRAAAVRFARAGDREHSVMADIGQADALSYLGRFDEARSTYTRARLRAQSHGLPVLAASADNGRALLDLSQGRYREALAGLEASRRAFVELGLAHRLAEAEKSLADAYLELRLLPEAIALYTAVLASMRAQEAGATLPWVQAQLARAQALCGDAAAALRTLAGASSAFDAQDSAAGRATVWAVRSALHAAAGQPREALSCALEACQGFRDARLPAQQMMAQVQEAAARVASGEAAHGLRQCEALLDGSDVPPQVRVRAQVERAEALLALARRDDARAALEAAIEGIEELRAALPGDDFRRAFLADASRPYAQRLQFALDDVAAEGPLAVLKWLERFKARALRERLGSGAVEAVHVAGSEALRARLNWIYRCQQRLVEDEGDAPAALHDEAARLESELLEAARRERLLLAPGAAPLEHVFDLAALPAALGAGRALVEYGVVGDELFALVVRSDGVRLHRRMASWAAVVQAVQGLRFQLDTLRAGESLPAAHAPMLQDRARRRLAQLHALVWRPLESDVTGCERLLIVPHGVLHSVPFAALGEGAGALLDRHEIVMGASAAVAWRGLRHGDAGIASGPALVLGDGSRLAHVAAELQAVRNALAGVRLLEGTDASVAALCANAGEADLLHLACHAQFRADSPLYSALHLADGALTAEQVQGLRLHARLVVLSACESAVGDTGIADEGVGLVRAFLMAGAARVLGSHWAVDDAVAADLMADFYRRWRSGMRVAAALREAQRAMRERRPHPAHWAAFALHGAA
jgi:tetratricopeptide (TPR) repeat protein